MSTRYTRYQDILSEEKLRATKATIIGVGAIGRQVAIQLSAMGIGSMQLIDFDGVDGVNLGPQAYRLADIGRPKVEATADACQALNPDIEITCVNDRFTRELPVHPVVFCCVDTITARKMIWRSLHECVDWFGDARMAAETMRLLVAADVRSRAHYPTTLFSQKDAYRAPCTAKSTVYCANVAAGLLVGQLSLWIRGYRTIIDSQLSLLSMEITTIDN